MSGVGEREQKGDTDYRASWSPLEVASVDECRRLEELELGRQMEYLYNSSPFYREKLDEAGIDYREVVGRDQLAHVPFTEKSELRASLSAAPPLGAHLAADIDEVVQVQATSGTTGTPSYLALTSSDCEVWNELGARAFFAAGLRPRDAVLHAWSMSKGFTGGIPVVKMLQYLGCRVLPIGAEAGTDRVLNVIESQNASALCAAPNLAIYIAEQSERVLGRTADTLGVSNLVVGGEPGGGIPPVRQKLQSLWGAQSCEVLGNSDIATLVWAECSERSGMHFVGQGLVLVELVDPVTGAVVEPVTGLKAEIVYTALNRQASPLLRFRSRDHVEVLGTTCACGRTAYKLRCFGRTDDMLIVRGVNVWPTAVQEIVSKFRPATTGVLRIVADFEGHSTNDPLRIQIETAPGVRSEESARIKEEIGRHIREMLVFQPDIEMLPADTLPKPGSAKVSLVERTMR
jgi:phenylacetate-CoA ligase